MLHALFLSCFCIFLSQNFGGSKNLCNGDNSPKNFSGTSSLGIYRRFSYHQREIWEPRVSKEETHVYLNCQKLRRMYRPSVQIVGYGRRHFLHVSSSAFTGHICLHEDHKIDGPRGREGHVDLLSTLISSEVEDDGTKEERLTPTEIKALFLNLFIAGTDTTSTTVEWAIAELIHHPDILAQAQQELDSVVGKDRLVAESDFPHLTFLQAVVKETFRLHPSTPLSLPRITNDSCEINGYFIPKGATLLVNVWSIGRDPDDWVEPLEFWPQRFMPGGERANVDVRGTDFEMIPFGTGRRICAGVGLGIRMVQLLTAILIHAFDFGLVDGQLPQTLNMEEAFCSNVRTFGAFDGAPEA